MTTLRLLEQIDEVPAGAWNALLPDDHPFVDHGFLAALEAGGSLREALGWRASHLTLWRDGDLVAAAPLYLKANSHGEFVFDHAWAEASHRAGIAYYPKLLVAVPYSPVTGPRLLARAGDIEARRALADALVDLAERHRLSSAHVNFATDDDAAVLGDDPRWLERVDIQFHWHDRGWRDFADFLDALNARRRKEMRRERERLLREGWQFDWRGGSRLTESELDVVHACYVSTFDDKGNYPALTRESFGLLAERLCDRVQVVFAHRGGAPEAMAFYLRGGGTLYGRYWGARGHVPGLHFECCYHQAIEYALREGLRHIEPGAQGEHKLARGFLPTPTRSFHYLRNPGLRTAVAHALARERVWFAGYRESLLAHTPYAGERG